MSNKILKIIGIIIVLVLIILGVLCIIDFSKMSKGEPVVFSTWGKKYSPIEKIVEYTNIDY